MPLSIQCPQGHKLSVPEKYAGKSVKCPKCESVIKIPDLVKAREPTTPPPGFVDLSTDSTDVFGDLPGGFSQPQSTSTSHYYQPAAPAAKPQDAAPVWLEPKIIYISAGAAFAIGLVLTLGLGFVLL